MKPASTLLRFGLHHAAALVALVGLGACGSTDVVPSHAPKPNPPPPSVLVHDVAAKADGLVFPPPIGDARRSRPASHTSHAALDEQVRVVEPEPDNQGHLALRGKTVRVRFNQPMAGAKPNAPAGSLLSIEPAVPGLARWVDEYTLEFAAKDHFDPEQRYRLVVPPLRSQTDSVLAKPFEIAFHATPVVFVAGKALAYIPKPGEPRVIVTRPSDDRVVGRRPKLAVLFDQPLTVGVAKGLIQLTGRDDKAIPFTLSHPPQDQFNGIKVDRRLVVLVHPARQLQHGERLWLKATDQVPDKRRRSTPIELTVAPPLRDQGVDCYYYARDDETCDFDKRLLRTSGRRVHVRFNNPIATKDERLAGHVRVTPPVRNLTVVKHGWSDGRLLLGGDFRPSTRYQVTVAGLTDRYGGRQSRPVRFGVQVLPLGASATMAEGLLLLDDQTTKAFPVVTRNVERAELVFFPVPRDDVAAFRRALKNGAGIVQSGGFDAPIGAPAGAAQALKPVRVPVPVRAVPDKLVETKIDLRKHLTGGGSYLATVRPAELAFGAERLRFPRHSTASRPPVALVRVGHPNGLAVHTHSATDATVVHVARLRSGEPLAGATVSVVGSGDGPSAKTDAHGVAVLRGEDGRSAERLLRVQSGPDHLLLPLARPDATSDSLFPHLVGGELPVARDRRAVLVTDRGIYRPGATIEMKAQVFVPRAGKLQPVRGQIMQLEVVGPTDDVVCSHTVLSSALGSVLARCAVPSDAKLGRHQVRVKHPLHERPIAKSTVRVAAFEPPKFAVDVHLDDDARPGELGAVVRGRYLFGAAMSNAPVEWSLRRSEAPFPSGPLTDGGLAFRPRSGWFDSGEQSEPWRRTGEGQLDPDGALQIRQPLSLQQAVGPQRFALEADVTDSSYRHVAGRGSFIKHPAPRYAGIKGPGGWVPAGQDLSVELGVIDTRGAPVVGATVTARLSRVSWRYVQRRVSGGALRGEWTATRRAVARCAVKSEARAKSCAVPVQLSGDYEITAEVDGRPGGRVSFWAWRDGDTTARPSPSKGSVLPIATDKARYQPGDKAQLLVRNPYPAATAVVTVERGGLVFHRASRITGSAGVIEVPIEEGYAPHAHATVTLLPVGATGSALSSHRVGAVRLPVAPGASALGVTVASSQRSYEPGDEAEITVTVTTGGTPRAGAEVALAVVDEGVLRLTGFHPPDPVAALRPGRPLDFQLSDTRSGLGELFERSHVAGGGGSDGESPMPRARSNFVKTALWRPALRTDSSGRAQVRFKLPDNLTEFRMMAVALDEQAKGGVAQKSFTVTKPVLLSAIVPRFATVGDQLEIAALLHNTSAQPFHGMVRFGDRIRPVSVPAAGRQRVAFTVLAEKPGPINATLAVADAQGIRDRVLRTIEVQQPGLEHRPRLSGAFHGEQSIDLRLPEDVLGDGSVIIKVGQHLWPELGARLEYLLDYPHGCVEQTTSSTLPLIAARDIMPRIGLSHITPGFLNKRIEAGVERLASMRTPSGGLGYWPGDGQPNVYGTAYAIRAVLLARQAGVSLPSGLLEGMTRYLGQHLMNESIEPEVRAAIAHSLAEAGELPASATDALYDLGAKSSVFGRASLALALGGRSAEDPRLDRLLDQLEEAFSEQGKLLEPPKSKDFSYFGSTRRSMSQAAIALGRLRQGSTRVPLLVQRLAARTHGYTTQATAYSLLALADFLKATARDGAPVQVDLDGRSLEPHGELGGGGREYRVDLASLKGKRQRLRLHSSGEGAVAFQVEARYRRPLSTTDDSVEHLVATSAKDGPDVYRFYSDAQGKPLNLAQVQAGQVVRVALLVKLPESLSPDRRGYVAITDRLPAGFEPLDPDLATVASVPEVSDDHPLASMLRYNGGRASHVALHDDRVLIYFDRSWQPEVVATYLARATTPGEFVLPPAAAELMYEPNSLSYSDAGRVVIQ